MSLAIVAGISAADAGAWGHDLCEDLEQLHVRHTTEHYALAGTVNDTKLQHYGAVLEYVYREYAAGFGELLAGHDADGPAPEQTPFRVVILATADEYSEFTEAYLQGACEHSTGMFVPSADLLLIRDDGDRERTYGTLFHEAFHQFARRHIPAIPIWLNEGLATYYGTAKPARSGLRFDRRASYFFRVVRDAAPLGALVPLRELMDASRTAFYREKQLKRLGYSHKTLCYAQSYTLVSYMLDDRGGREHVRAYLRKLSEAKTSNDAREVTRAMFPDHLLAAMRGPWLAHVNRH